MATEMSMEVAAGVRSNRVNVLRIAQSSASNEHGRMIVEVNPFRCRVWAMHDRLEEYVTEDSCRAEIESFKAHGQLVPALGRPLRGDPSHDIEIVYGGRRLFIARYLGMQLKVELREMTDQQAAIAMDIENRHRKDTSPYERGITYQRWLRSKFFNSQDDIARILNMSPSQISRLMKLAQLPAVIVNAFVSPLDIREGWGTDLHKVWQDEKRRQLVAQRARAIAEMSPRLSAPEVFQRLIAPSGATVRPRPVRRDELVVGDEGTVLFRIRRQRNTVALLLPSKAAEPSVMQQVREAVAGILQFGRNASS